MSMTTKQKAEQLLSLHTQRTGVSRQRTTGSNIYDRSPIGMTKNRLNQTQHVEHAADTSLRMENHVSEPVRASPSKKHVQQHVFYDRSKIQGDTGDNEVQNF